MMEQEQFPTNTPLPAPQPQNPWQPQPVVRKFLPAGKWELIFGAALLVISLLMINSIFFAGFHLGFAIAALLSILCSCGYLLISGCKLTPYSAALLAISLVICASFPRTDDRFTKFVMVCFLFFSTNISLSIIAGKNRFSPGSIRSLSDAFAAFFGLGFGQLPDSCRGLSRTLRSSGSAAQKSTSILLGLGIAVPILLILVPLLVQADAAFEGLLTYLPDFSIGEIIFTAIFGFCFAYLLYTRNTALKHAEVTVRPKRIHKGLSPLTVNTVLVTVCLVYLAYLISQLAYFTGGFAGILPEDYTLAQYARRGFFEMAWLCAINLSVMVLSLSVCAKEQAAPSFTRWLCLFIGVVTLFLVATASAKMLLYIDSYGLTRLRVLTQVVMVFLGLVTIFVCIWLFVPKMPYMKAVLLTALVMGAVVSWVDVDTFVARHNVTTYLEGKAETVDVHYLNALGNGAVPYLDQLTREAPDESVREDARFVLENRWIYESEDFRSWNYVNQKTEKLLAPYQEAREDTPLY